MLSKSLYSTFSCLPFLVLAAPSPVSHQALLHIPDDHGISKSLFNELSDLAKIIDITNCLQTAEGITYPFECNSFCREFPELNLVKQWNANDLAEGDSGGYVAVDHDGRKIFVVIAGSYSGSDASVAAVDYSPIFSGSKDVCPGCKVHSGFYRDWIKTEQLIGDAIKDLVKQYIEADKENPYQLVIVGRNSGGAVATLAAVDFEAKGWNPQITTFGQPKVGNEAFTGYLTERFTPSTYRRVTHISDPVPQFPPSEAGFSHYEHVYFISKPFAPYSPSNIFVCNSPSDPACTPSPDLDWTPNDYFHHTDNCIREPTSSFSFLLLGFDIFEPFTKAKRANFDPEFYTVLETIDEVPEPEGDNGIQKHVEKTQPARLKSAFEKRGMALGLDPDIDSIPPSGSLHKAFVMLDEEAGETPPQTEYEDEEIYNTMAGFDKAQEMWIKKPQGVASKQKIPDEFFEEGMLPGEGSAKGKGNVIVDPDFEPSKKSDGPRNVETGIYAGPITKHAEWGPETGPVMYNTINKAKRNVYVHPKAGHPMYLQTLTSRDNISNDDGEEPTEGVDSAKPEKTLWKRGFERALKFFHAPKEVLDAQLAANQEAALYNAQQKAGTNPDTEEVESGDPDEDYFKGGGSVLILNGRPLEVDGKPVLYEPPVPKGQPQKRSQIPHGKGGHGPGLGIKRGGAGPGGKVAGLRKLMPAYTNSRPESEVVDSQKGRNVVLLNGRPMPPIFSQKSVTEGENSGRGVKSPE